MARLDEEINYNCIHECVTPKKKREMKEHPVMRPILFDNFYTETFCEKKVALILK